MTGWNTQFYSNIPQRFGRRKMLHVQSDGKGCHPVRPQPVSMYQLLAVAFSAGHDNHVEQLPIQQVRGPIVVEGRGNMPGTNDFGTRID